MISRLRRFFLRWRWMVDYEKTLLRRATVEQELMNCASGKCPLPDADQCRKWAIKLGVPDEWRAEQPCQRKGEGRC